MNIYKELQDILSESKRLNNYKTVDKIVNLTVRLSQIDDVRVLNQPNAQQELETLRAENATLKNEMALAYKALQQKGVNLEDLAATVATMKQLPEGYDIRPSANLSGATVFESPLGVTTVNTFENNTPINKMTVDLNNNTTVTQ